MKTWLLLSTLLVVGLVTQVTSLQVAPGSPCSPVCLDVPGSDVTDPEGSNTFTTDIVCRDNEYTDNVVGKKFKSCLTCLQGSGWSGFAEHDQAWFLYNLRFAAVSCIFDYGNMTLASETPSCSADSGCGPVKSSLLADSLDPKAAVFTYCTASGNGYLASPLDQCTSCLRGTQNESHLANFITALKAGCLQRPVNGLSIGLHGDVFSTTPIQVTFAGDHSTSSSESSTKKKGLSQGAIIAIAVSVGVTVVVGAFLLAWCMRRRNQALQTAALKSPLDARFGSKTITSPNSGAYGNPYSSPQVHVVENFSAKELDDLELASPLPSAKSHISSFSRPRGDPSIRLDTSAASMMPIHQAYIPGVTSPVSPASTGTRRNSQLSNFSSPKPSPQFFLSTIESPQSPPDSAITEQREYPTSLQARRPEPRGRTESARMQPTRLPSQSHQHQDDDSQTSRVYSNKGMHSYSQTTASSRIYSDSDRSDARTRNRSRSVSRSRAPIPERPTTLRSNSVSENWGRTTLLMGVGNANASQEKPLKATATHGTRLDFEMAERERLDRERRGETPREFDKRKRADVTPSSATSGEEQWPGQY